MKLLVHNMLTSKFLKVSSLLRWVRMRTGDARLGGFGQGVSGSGYPLRIIAEKVEKKESEFNDAFIRKHLERLDYGVLRAAAEAIGEGEGLPEAAPAADAPDDVLRRLHALLLDVEVMEGALECPETGRRFPIANGIPNMLVNEDEVA